MNFIRTILFAVLVSLMSPSVFAKESQRQVFFGDTHLHSSVSADAYLSGNFTADPDTAYRFAKGLPVVHPYSRTRIQIQTPLDFLVVADHAAMLGVPLRISQADPELLKTENGSRWAELLKSPDKNLAKLFHEFYNAAVAVKPIEGFKNDVVTRSVWRDSVAVTERHNEPGKFTSFIGWEWTSSPMRTTMHRVIFTPNGADVAEQFLPYSTYDSERPEDLWAWLDNVSRETGGEFLAIPHNTNLSGGRIFAMTDSKGNPISAAYAQTRMAWEPLVEITQAKGDSETHPILSPDDEFAEFESFAPSYRDAIKRGKTDVEHPFKPGSYARSGLLRGLEIEEKVGVNPFKFGMIGASDMHGGVSSVEENNFYGKFAIGAIPENASKPTGGWEQTKGWDFSAGGLAAVWAEENTRESLFAAFKRKEVYATTGTRLRVRFFGGWDFNKRDAKRKNLAETGYRKGVPMGGDLTHAPKGKVPSFLIFAAKDPVGANLDRIQIVKGWIDENGQAQEKIFNVALADNRKPDADGHVAAVGNTVNLDEASYSNRIGDTQLAAVWEDEEFDPDHRAFYYTRVLEIPTPRHSLYDAVALGIEHPEEYPASIQERAYTSPIWYTP